MANEMVLLVPTFASAAKNYILSTPTTSPLFLVWTPFGPHSALATTTSGVGAIGAPKPAAQDLGTFSNLPPIRTPSFNEADVSDKPLWLQGLPLMTAQQIAASDTFNQRAVEALQSVDRGAAQIFSALQQTGRWNNTMVIFVGDNGIANGEHRVDNTKFCPYEECMRVPLWIRIPGNTARHDSNLIGNIDFAPTILDWAGVSSTAKKMNGVSLMPLLTNPSTPWRSEILFELIGTGTTTRNFQGVRTSRYLYNEYQDGEKELYDLQSDPYELTNSVNDPNYASVIPGLQALLANLKSQ
jgi:arylsulfatase A-like enzyme